MTIRALGLHVNVTLHSELLASLEGFEGSGGKGSTPGSENLRCLAYCEEHTSWHWWNGTIWADSSGGSHPDLATHDALGLATDTELSTHTAAADPHTGYQKESEKGIASGYAELDIGGTVPDTQLPAGLTRDSEHGGFTPVGHHAAFIQVDHDALPNPHHAVESGDSGTHTHDARYYTETEHGGIIPTGHHAAFVQADHDALPNPHHAQLHRAAHISGGGDALLNTDLIEAIVKRLQESGGATLLLGAVADGQYLKRSGTGIIGGTPAGGGISTLKKTADQIINGTALQNITDLTFAVAINTDYAFKFYIVFRSAVTTTGFKFALNGPAGAIIDYWCKYQTVANSTTVGVATWLERHSIVYDSMSVETATITAGVDLVCMIEGRVKVGATSGTLAARVASELANNDLVVQKGSWGLYF